MSEKRKTLDIVVFHEHRIVYRRDDVSAIGIGHLRKDLVIVPFDTSIAPETLNEYTRIVIDQRVVEIPDEDAG